MMMINRKEQVNITIFFAVGFVRPFLVQIILSQTESVRVRTPPSLNLLKFPKKSLFE